MTLGIGDDAAVINGQVVSTDALVDSVHFRQDWSSAEDIGHKAGAQAMADVVAMGAVPTSVLVSLACPETLALKWIDGFFDGLMEECQQVGAVIAGGDVVKSDRLTIAMTALGDLQGRSPITRSGARPGDVVALTGRLGWAAAGLAVLGRGFRSPAQVVGAHRRPQPPYAEGIRAADLGAQAMADVSDGLVQDVGHIARASGVQIDLRTDALTVPDRLRDVGSALGVEPMQWVLTGGEDHALVAAFGPDVELPAEWTVIGAVQEGEPGVLLDGAQHESAGFDHFGTA